MLNDAINMMPNVFSPEIIKRGLAYYREHHVLNIRFSDGLIKARVKGSHGHIYDVHLDLKQWPKKQAVCSCPWTYNCKHAVAALLAMSWTDQQKSHDTKQLRYEQEHWLETLSKEPIESKKESPTQALSYLIDIYKNHVDNPLVLRLALSRYLKKGGLGKKSIVQRLPASKRELLEQNDQDILAKLFFLDESTQWPGYFIIRQSHILEKLIATKKLYLSEDDDSPVQQGETIQAGIEWDMDSFGTQTLKLTDSNGLPLDCLLLDKPWHFDVYQNTLHPVECAYGIYDIKKFLEAPSVEINEAEAFSNKLKERQSHLPLPEVFHNILTKNITPKVQLTFDFIDAYEPMYLVDISFDYDGMLTNALMSPKSNLFRKQQGTMYEFIRDFEVEQQHISDIDELLHLRQPAEYLLHQIPRLEGYLISTTLSRAPDLTSFYQSILPKLYEKGYDISFLGDAYQEIIDTDELEWMSDIALDLNGFFRFQPGVIIDGEAVSIVPLVAQLLQTYHIDELLRLNENERVRLSHENKLLDVPLGRIKPIIELMLQLNLKDAHDELYLPKEQLALLDEAQNALKPIHGQWQALESVRARLLSLSELKQDDVYIPKKLNATLRDYQVQGLSWLKRLKDNDFSGILADDMGLGKTIQTLAHLLAEKEQGYLSGPSLIVAPTSLMGNWFAEAQKFTPDLNVLIWHGSDRHQDSFDGIDLIISTYGLIQRDAELFCQQHFYYLILDEAQCIKNAQTKTTRIINQLKAKHRLCLSGTPLENHLGELWSLFHFLMPGLLGQSKQFRQWFQTPIEKHQDVARQVLLRNRIKPFLLRRRKQDVAKELPPKTEIIQKISLEGAQRDLYEAVRLGMEKKVREAIAAQGLNKSHILLLDALLKLRQICCDPRLLKMPEDTIKNANSAKLDALMNLLESLIDEGRRILIFSQFTSMLKLIEDEVKKAGYPYLKLTGQSTKRQELVDSFQTGDIPLFLISLKAGGTGLNLTQADTVIHYDPWWNPAVESQATDRSHRIGQEQPVFVYKLVTEGTVEEAILKLQERKKHLSDGVLLDNATDGQKLSESDIEEFFSPLVD